MNFNGKDIISMKSISKEMIDCILNTAEKLELVAHGKIQSDILKGKILALLFFEPSTRTRMSFETAMIRLGGTVINMSSIEASSIAKGETLADTIRVVNGYADAIVLRHPKEGAAQMASEFSLVPILNAGDGAGHHPTQTLLDLYTIKKEGNLDNINIAIIGDLKYGRTVHSLMFALSLYGAKVTLVSPKELKIPSDILNELSDKMDIVETDSIKEVIDKVDILYVTRIQKERFPDISEYQKVATSFRITPDLLKSSNPNLKILHPLPRVNEIDPAIDDTHAAAYFKQSFYGVSVRMALLSLILSQNQ
ncbi:MAG: aspartate carbamoyltransferase [Methanosarcinales archaeon]|nr:aspartate carbamoyltransferase [Methanosarcinales archaeon]